MLTTCAEVEISGEAGVRTVQRHGFSIAAAVPVSCTRCRSRALTDCPPPQPLPTPRKSRPAQSNPPDRQRRPHRRCQPAAGADSSRPAARPRPCDSPARSTIPRPACTTTTTIPMTRIPDASSPAIRSDSRLCPIPAPTRAIRLSGAIRSDCIRATRRRIDHRRQAALSRMTPAIGYPAHAIGRRGREDAGRC